MSSRLAAALSIAAVTAAALAGCAQEAAPQQAEDDPIGTVVPSGKADDFLSASAQEYLVEGELTITLDAADWADATEAEREAEVRRLVPFKQVWLGWFLNQYLVDKDSHGESEGEPYGGFKALTKNGSYEDLDLRPSADDPLTWTFTIRQEVGGQLDLIDALGAESTGPDTWRFDLWVGVVDNDALQELETDAEWYRRSPWSSFDPSKVSDAQKFQVPLTIRPEPRSDDAWIDANRLFADDTLTVGIHFGWDYHNAYHEVHSKDVYDWLLARGFESPVDSWEELRHDAGPLVGSTTWNGRQIRVEVSLFWGRSGDATDPDTDAGGKQLEADMLESLRSREVVMFSGHSGPFYGFALANWRKTYEGDLDDSELAFVDLNVGNYQLIVAEGCDTYAIGQAFYLNEDKPGLLDMDIITTTSFSNASSADTVTDTLAALIGSNGTSAAPTKYSELLSDLDRNSYWFDSMYGVHGIDDNPTVHPLADLARTCETCRYHSDCGEGMRCTAMADGEKVCAALCTASRDCGEGRACRNVQAGGWLQYMTCVPESLSCEVPVDEPVRLMINELAADPASGDVGDLNGDGVRHYGDDEFVEIVNLSAVEVNLTGWTLSDRVMVRHAFPGGTVLPPGGALVVFGGGEPNLAAGTTIVQTASTGALGLNNSGDAVKLADADGNPVATAEYGAEGGQDQAIVRATDGDDTAGWVLGEPTPGTKADGSQF